MNTKIPEDEQQNLLENFWQTLQECETKANCDNDFVLRHLVEQWYQTWNRLHGTNMKPKWSNGK